MFDVTLVKYVVEDGLRRIIIKWWNSSHKLIKANSQSPPIYRGAVLLTTEQLGS
jgi:hypothetical protein